jgi:hypothetical protein
MVTRFISGGVDESCIRVIHEHESHEHRAVAIAAIRIELTYMHLLSSVAIARAQSLHGLGESIGEMPEAFRGCELRLGVAELVDELPL